eukprot:1307186-Rhodomonas_salina.3
MQSVLRVVPVLRRLQLSPPSSNQGDTLEFASDSSPASPLTQNTALDDRPLSDSGGRGPSYRGRTLATTGKLDLYYTGTIELPKRTAVGTGGVGPLSCIHSGYKGRGAP